MTAKSLRAAAGGRREEHLIRRVGWRARGDEPHSSITITLDRYGHLFPGSEDEAAALLDSYLARATSAAREAALSA
jgi:hypothetical protein